jgi:hypothetical protein
MTKEASAGSAGLRVGQTKLEGVILPPRSDAASPHASQTIRVIVPFRESRRSQKIAFVQPVEWF